MLPPPIVGPFSTPPASSSSSRPSQAAAAAPLPPPPQLQAAPPPPPPPSAATATATDLADLADDVIDCWLSSDKVGTPDFEELELFADSLFKQAIAFEEDEITSILPEICGDSMDTDGPPSARPLSAADYDSSYDACDSCAGSPLAIAAATNNASIQAKPEEEEAAKQVDSKLQNVCLPSAVLQSADPIEKNRPLQQQTVCVQSADPINNVCRPSADPINNVCRPFADPINNVCRPSADTINNVCRPSADIILLCSQSADDAGSIVFVGDVVMEEVCCSTAVAEEVVVSDSYCQDSDSYCLDSSCHDSADDSDVEIVEAGSPFSIISGKKCVVDEVHSDNGYESIGSPDSEGSTVELRQLFPELW